MFELDEILKMGVVGELKKRFESNFLPILIQF